MSPLERGGFGAEPPATPARALAADMSGRLPTVCWAWSGAAVASARTSLKSEGCALGPPAPGAPPWAAAWVDAEAAEGVIAEVLSWHS